MFKITIRTLQRLLNDYKNVGNLYRKKTNLLFIQNRRKHVKYILKIMKKN